MDLLLYINEKFNRKPTKPAEIFGKPTKKPWRPFFEIAARLAEVQQIDGKTNVQIRKNIKSIFATLLEQLRILCRARDMAHRLRSTVLAYWFRDKSGHCGCSTAQVQPYSSETSSTESCLIQRVHTD